LIYEGQFLINKKAIKTKTISLNIDKREENKPKDNPKILTKGSFSGLVVLFNQSKCYEYNLISVNYYNVLFRTKVDDFPEFKYQIF
jgi:hypothetical protein